MTPAASLRTVLAAIDTGSPVSADAVAAAIGELRTLQTESARSMLRRRRAAAIAALADALAPGARVSARVDAVRRSVRVYVARWRRVDRFLADMPISYVGKPEQYLWSAFSAGSQLDSDDPVPLGKTFLRGILVSHCNNSDT